MKRLSVFFPKPLNADIREEALPSPQPGQALVKTTLSAISPGSELLVYRGEAPDGLAVDETISALGGSFGFPIKYGYAAVGHVVELGAGASDEDRALWLDRLVFAFNPHETYFLANLADLHPVPEGLSAEAAALLPNMETALSFVMDGRPVIGEQIAVLGQGVVGLLTTALLAGMSPLNLITLDGYPLRREWSAHFGANAALDASDPEVIHLARHLLSAAAPGDGADLVYELSGNPRALDTAINLTGFAGRVIVGSWYGRKPMSLDLGGRFHRAHIRLRSSQVSLLDPQWSGRWSKARRLDLAWSMIRQHRPEQLITHRYPITQAADTYRLLDERPEESIQIVFTY